VGWTAPPTHAPPTHAPPTHGSPVHGSPVHGPAARGPAEATRDVPQEVSPPPGRPLPHAPVPLAPLPDAPSADALPRKAASATAPLPPLARRQPGKTLIESESGAGDGDAGKPRSPSQPAPEVEATTPVAALARNSQDWGAADEGWRAARALAMPVSAELTARGLPRRQPRALLVPGTAGGAEPATNAPARSAESIRGRLASYQQGVREGRQARRTLETQSLETQDYGSLPQQVGEEETT
jgi:hypothetical protein